MYAPNCVPSRTVQFEPASLTILRLVQHGFTTQAISSLTIFSSFNRLKQTLKLLPRRIHIRFEHSNRRASVLWLCRNLFPFSRNPSNARIKTATIFLERLKKELLPMSDRRTLNGILGHLHWIGGGQNMKSR